MKMQGDDMSTIREYKGDSNDRIADLVSFDIKMQRTHLNINVTNNEKTTGDAV